MKDLKGIHIMAVEIRNVLNKYDIWAQNAKNYKKLNLNKVSLCYFK